MTKPKHLGTILDCSHSIFLHLVIFKILGECQFAVSPYDLSAFFLLTSLHMAFYLFFDHGTMTGALRENLKIIWLLKC